MSLVFSSFLYCIIMKEYIELNDKHGNIAHISLPYDKIISDGTGCTIQWTENEDVGPFQCTASFSQSMEEIIEIIHQNANTTK